ncbi:outer membrane protein [Aestuariivirga sp.]|jgi:outer membrane immunogenic protein|uniref:outer membrane protein n=1 Tax=Aestuariivirga sp. TaxID=2650926 RepID=UPI00378350FD
MKISLLAMVAASSVLIAASANAADVEVVDTAAGWSGFYVGAAVGYGGASFDGVTDTSEGDTEDSTWMSGDLQGGLTYGGYAGFNIDHGGIVFGLEADFGGADFSETAADDDGDDIDTHDVNWIGTLRGRVGASYDSTLIYMTGGVALAGSTFESTDNKNSCCENTGKDDLLSVGYVIGAGLEHQFHNNISLRLEGLYYGAMNEHTYNENELQEDMDSGDYAKIDGMVQIRAGLGYHF